MVRFVVVALKHPVSSMKGIKRGNQPRHLVLDKENYKQPGAGKGFPKQRESAAMRSAIGSTLHAMR